MYYQGQGVPQDYAEAVRWFRKAADQGDATAQRGLGYMYDQGKGVSQDHAEAFRWYRKAAEHGDASAQSTLGFSYFHGQGASQDYAEAVRWYRKAAEQGDVDAQYTLSIIYRDGRGVPQNYGEAVRWYSKVFAKAAASCFARQGGPAARWTSIVVILLSLLILAVARRRWATWLPWALTSADCAVMLAHELLLSPPFAARLSRGLLGTPYRGFGRLLFLALLAGGSVIFAVMAVQVAARRSKRGGDASQPKTPAEETVESPR